MEWHSFAEGELEFMTEMGDIEVGRMLVEKDEHLVVIVEIAPTEALSKQPVGCGEYPQ